VADFIAASAENFTQIPVVTEEAYAYAAEEQTSRG